MNFETMPLVIHADTQSALSAFLKKPSHALLLLGRQGIGKRTLAKAIAQQLMLLSEVAASHSAYLYVVTPAQTTISIAAIREIRSFLKLRVPTKESLFNRVVIIEDAHCMTREAQNALLKLLEEPPERTAFICTATMADALLPTVRSRLQIIRVRQPSTEATIEHFVQQGMPSDSIKRLLLMHDGNIAAVADELVAGASMAPELTRVKELLQATTFERLAAVDGMAKQKTDAAAFVQALSMTATASLRNAAAMEDTERIRRWERVAQATQVAGQALAHNANTKIVLTELMLSL